MRVRIADEFERRGSGDARHNANVLDTERDEHGPQQIGEDRRCKKQGQ
jgi:hypothetical protein